MSVARRKGSGTACPSPHMAWMVSHSDASAPPSPAATCGAREFADTAGEFADTAGEFADTAGEFADTAGAFADTAGEFADTAGEFADTA
eukprot:780261-Prorocentrum_minimum.AAC.1